jgi:hypothetical protein
MSAADPSDATVHRTAGDTPETQSHRVPSRHPAPGGGWYKAGQEAGFIDAVSAVVLLEKPRN